jgi:hypothetical protein
VFALQAKKKPSKKKGKKLLRKAGKTKKKKNAVRLEAVIEIESEEQSSGR